MALEPDKRAWETFIIYYTFVWLSVFAVIVGFGYYEDFDEWSYLKVCCGLAFPVLVQPMVYPSLALFGQPSSDAHRSWTRRYSLHANLWMAVYSFIGNYWYTHYFYTVLRAEYTMPAHRVNNVPIAMFFATHFFFCTYHVLSNMILRKIESMYRAGWLRSLLKWSTIVVLSYAIALAESVGISAFPDWKFEDRHEMYRIGSAFYGIYFLVSFPAFYHFEPRGLGETIVSSCGYGMIILCLLDFVRLYLDIPLVIDLA